LRSRLGAECRSWPPRPPWLRLIPPLDAPPPDRCVLCAPLVWPPAWLPAGRAGRLAPGVLVCCVFGLSFMFLFLNFVVNFVNFVNFAVNFY
ncbi:MAG: hypothetical protein AAB726_02075, partial [Patescibacteria group bacterium]